MIQIFIRSFFPHLCIISIWNGLPLCLLCINGFNGTRHLSHIAGWRLINRGLFTKYQLFHWRKIIWFNRSILNISALYIFTVWLWATYFIIDITLISRIDDSLILLIFITIFYIIDWLLWVCITIKVEHSLFQRCKILLSSINSDCRFIIRYLADPRRWLFWYCLWLLSLFNFSLVYLIVWLLLMYLQCVRQY